MAPAPHINRILGGGRADTLAPTVLNVTATNANGTYYTSDTVGIQVVFTEPVLVTGTPQLTLETGSSDAVVNYTSGSGTNTLLFNYTPSVGHASSDLDVKATNSLALNGGTIQDAAANNATLTVPVGATSGSLASNKNIVIGEMTVLIKYTSNAGATMTSGGAHTTILFEDLILDTDTDYNTATGLWTVRATGNYLVIACITFGGLTFAASDYCVVHLKVNGTDEHTILSQNEVQAAATLYWGNRGMNIVSLTAGDLVYIRCKLGRGAGNGALHTDGQYNFLTIYKCP